MQGAENMKEDREENTPDPSVTETEGSGAFYADDDTLTLSTLKLIARCAQMNGAKQALRGPLTAYLSYPVCWSA